MIIELHIIQSFGPANLNRDDTGAPKDCEFGGTRRARVSSQCWKRAMREHFAVMKNPIASENLGIRTKKVGDYLRAQLEEKGKSGEELEAMISLLNVDYLVFLGRTDRTALRDYCLENWEDLLGTGTSEKPVTAGKKSKGKDKAKKVGKAFEDLPRATAAADIALFGRMIADAPGRNIDAAAQVAHAISTHRVAPDIDYFTALDDLTPDDQSGAGMIGSTEFNAACYYRYLNVDVRQLRHNLADESLVPKAVHAYVKAAVEAIPKAKQNSMAALNLPTFVFAVARDAGGWNLSNAFVKAIRTDGDGVVANSISHLLRHWNDLVTMYGNEGIHATLACTLGSTEVREAAIERCPSLEVMYQAILSKVA